MEEAWLNSPISAAPFAAPACVAGFLCTDPPVILALSAISTSAAGTEPSRDASPLMGQDVTSTHVPDALAQPWVSSTTPIHVAEKENATELMPPPPVKRETVLGLPAPSAAPIPLPKGRKRNCPPTEMAKKRRYSKNGEGEPLSLGGSGLLPQHLARVRCEIPPFLYQQFNPFLDYVIFFSSSF